jgi:hypothetical protein
MGGACGTYGGRRGVYGVLVGETGGERVHLEQLDVDTWTTVNWSSRNMMRRLGVV